MFKVLYTHQKLKKRKTWQDGHLKIVSHRKAILLDEDSKSIDSLFFKDGQIENDVELESDKYLIQVEYEEENKENIGNISSNGTASSDGNTFTNNRMEASNNQCKNGAEISSTLQGPNYRPFHSVKRNQEVAKRAKEQMKEQINKLPPCQTETSTSSIAEKKYDSKFRKIYIENTKILSDENAVERNEARSMHIDVDSSNIDECAFNGKNNDIVSSKFRNSNYSISFKNNFQSMEYISGNSLNNSRNSNNYTCNSRTDSSVFQKRSSSEILALFETDDIETGDTVCIINTENKGSRFNHEIHKRVCNKRSQNDVFISQKDIKRGCLEPPEELTKFSEHPKLESYFHTSNSENKGRLGNSYKEQSSTYPQRVEPFSTDLSESIVSECDDNDQLLVGQDNEPFQRSTKLKKKEYNQQTTCKLSKSSWSSSISMTAAVKFKSPSTTNTNYRFPTLEECSQKITPRRSVIIPNNFNSAMEYKQIFQHALKEHINILLFDLATKYYGLFNSVDFSLLSSYGKQHSNGDHKGPQCKHGQAKLKSVRKEGKNNGKLFYSCPNNGENRCNFFVWFDEVNKSFMQNSNPNIPQSVSNNKLKFTDPKSAAAYFSSRKVELYCNCKVLMKPMYAKNSFKSKNKFKTLQNNKKLLYIVLPFKKSSSFYSREDLWIISKSLDFKSSETFIAKSVFYGPNASCELEVLPLTSFIGSNWHSDEICYAIHAFNASTELTCIENLEKNISSIDLPILKHILSNNKQSSHQNIYQRFNLNCLEAIHIENLIENVISSFELNQDQTLALKTISSMFLKDKNSSTTLIHGVFGSGKSYLLSTVVLFLVQLFEIIESNFTLNTTLKLLIASTTNVAVDRVLTGLMELGYNEFIRVGSLKKISKPILPYSIHACDQEDQELKELNDLMKTDLSDVERGYVRKALEQHKHGINRQKLADVRVVGVTCAASVFPYLQQLTFQVHLLDECSQMMEPLSLLPIARFKCEKLILVGDPKQLPPTIQGSEAEHNQSLELTMFERLANMGIQPIILRTQYRCHPLISNICSNLFYDGALINGVTEEQRLPIIEWLPTVSFFDVKKGEEKCEADGSFSNTKEAYCVVKLLGKIIKEGMEPSLIGVITQYRSQVHKISNLLREANINLPHSDLKMIQISTVDAFQGAEKEVIILSCVRSNNIGFIDSPRRTNVALSRAKRHLVLVGNYKLLKTNALWNQIILTCKNEKTMFMEPENFFKSIESKESK